MPHYCCERGHQCHITAVRGFWLRTPYAQPARVGEERGGVPGTRAGHSPGRRRQAQRLIRVPCCSFSLPSQIYCIENAHGQLVRDLDFNPNKQYYLASCGDDCKVKFWDIRNVTEPVKTLEEHSHWYSDLLACRVREEGIM